ncbi:MAG: hypothetical protein QW734_10245 [Candidatus Bathyarchaeia archaeon]
MTEAIITILGIIFVAGGFYFMVNYRLNNIEKTIEKLQKNFEELQKAHYENIIKILNKFLNEKQT